MDLKLKTIPRNKIIKALTALMMLYLSACNGSNTKTTNNSNPINHALKSQNITQDISLKNLKASNWNIIGNPSFSKSAVDNQKLLVAADGTKYIAFRDFSTNPKGQITVMYNKDERQDWQVLGNAGFSVGQVDSVNMVADSNGKLYVAYKDEGLNEKAVVMYYNSDAKQWQMLGGKPASADKVDSTSIAINPTNKQVYLAYSDYSNGVNGFAKVVKLDGNAWVNLGGKDYVLSNRVTDNSLAFDKQGKLYLAFSDKGFAKGRAAVMAYNSSSNAWEHLGSPGISQGVAGAITLVAGPDNTLYLASNMQVDGVGVHVLYYDKDIENWTSLGNTPVSDKYSLNVSLTISEDNKIYVAYRNPNEGGHADVVTLDDKTQNWAPVTNSAHVSPGNADYVAVSVDQDGTPYVAYCDLSTDGQCRSNVVKYGIEKFEQFAPGSNFQCVLMSGHVYCKGDNRSGKLGTGDYVNKTNFTRVLTNQRFTTISLGSDGHACAITSNGKAYCWGANYAGQLGDGSGLNKNTPVLVDTSTIGNVQFTSISLGYAHTCAIATNGKTYCWGYGIYGQLGDGNNEDKKTPALVNTTAIGNVQFISISLGWEHTCAIATNGKAYCWGYNSWGQLGDGTNIDRNTPVLVDTSVMGNVQFNSISLGYRHSCIITNNGKTYCWGLNSSGQLGDGTNEEKNTPALVDTRAIGNAQFSSLASGVYHSCAIATDGKTYCWGLNNNRQLGDNTINNRNKPVLVDVSSIGNSKFTHIFLAQLYSCSIDTNNEIFCWGSMPNMNVRQSYSLQNQKIALGYFHSCTISNEGKTYCWGKNSNGQLGDGTIIDKNTPVLVDTASIGNVQFTSIALGTNHTCAIATNGNTYCWGDNLYGQLGISDTSGYITKSKPVLVDTASVGNIQFTSLDLGEFYTCGLTTNGKIYCWGANYKGQLGDGTTVGRNKPTEINNSVIGNVQFTSLTVGWVHACAISTNGKTYCWGYNVDGQLGDGTTDDRTKPVLVDTTGIRNAQFTSLSLGKLHSCGIANDGKTYCWGYNVDGELGDGSSAYLKSRPSLIDTSSISNIQFTSIALGDFHSCAIAIDGKIYCWGKNGDGQLGNGTIVDNNKPILVDTIAIGNLQFTSLALKNNHSCAIATNGKTYCWGDNPYNVLGFETTFFPIKLP